ncbi:MAG: acyl-CoA thioesterase domain-containing protein [Actinomycetota bacterium]
MAGNGWLGLEQEADDRWRLPITEGVISGASALFGGCATAAAIAVARTVAEQPVVYAVSHFGALAQLGTTVTITSKVIAAGRTLTHLEVEGRFDDKHSFLTRVTAGSRPAQNAAGQWVNAPELSSVESSESFVHPVHEGTWAERFEWRLATVDAAARPTAAWWVRPLDPNVDPFLTGPILVDYVTYGVGRALGVPMGGLSVDNVVRVHRPTEAEWYLLVVTPEAIDEGLGYGTARLYADGTLTMTGTQSIVVNGWDWRLPDER